jgi:DNA-binding XRE family transcriptional regulator
MTVKNLVELYKISTNSSYNDLAKRLHVTRQTLFNMVNDNDGMDMKLSSLLKLCNVMDISLCIEGTIGPFEDPVFDGEDDSDMYE